MDEKNNDKDTVATLKLGEALSKHIDSTNSTKPAQEPDSPKEQLTQITKIQPTTQIAPTVTARASSPKPTTPTPATATPPPAEPEVDFFADMKPSYKAAVKVEKKPEEPSERLHKIASLSTEDVEVGGDWGDSDNVVPDPIPEPQQQTPKKSKPPKEPKVPKFGAVKASLDKWDDESVQ